MPVNPAHGAASADLDNDLNGEVLDFRDFPNVKFWFRTDFSKTKVTRFSKTKQRIVFIETKQGDPVPPSQVRSILKCARQFWEDLLTDGATPSSWGRAPPQIKDQFRNLLRNKFPEFKLCHNNWKADLLATGHYPPWYHYWVVQKGAKGSDEAEIPKHPKRRKTKPVSGISLFYSTYLLVTLPPIDDS